MSAIERAIAKYLEGSTVEEARGITAPPITTYMFYKGLDAHGINYRGKVSRKSEVPAGSMLECKSCQVHKPTDAFSKQPSCKTGYDVSRCKTCKKSKVDWALVPIENRMLNRTKARAQRKGLPFNLEISDIVLPERCPVFDKPFIYGDHLWTYSIDRLVPDTGYVRGNIMIISNKANMMKSTATTDEIGLLHKWMTACEISF